jgi:riboflavin kinase/FMN adenylyltransferase
MQIFRHHHPLPQAARGAVVAVGNFDGVHRGHAAVVEAARAEAARLGAPLAVLTFEPHPRQYFRPEDPPFRLTPFRIKARLLEALGIDLLHVLHFDPALAAMSAEEFAAGILFDGLGARHVVVGADFRFGHGRRGDAAMLEALAAPAGAAVTVLAKTGLPGRVFSATEARAHLAGGAPRTAASILGRPWEIEGRVEHGDKRGRTLGFPTANLELGEYLRPAYGVYAVRCAVDDGAPPVWRDGVANLGIRPMWQSERPILESFIFDFAGDLYGSHLRVQLVEYLRPELRFDGLEALVARMNQDCAEARAALAAG